MMHVETPRPQSHPAKVKVSESNGVCRPPKDDLLAGEFARDRAHAAGPETWGLLVYRVVGVAHSDRGTPNPLHLSAIGILAIPGKLGRLIGCGWIAKRKKLARHLDLENDVLEARRYVSPAERDAERLIGGLASSHPVTTIVQGERRSRQAYRFPEHLALALDDRGPGFVTGIIKLRIRLLGAGPGRIFGIGRYVVGPVPIEREVRDGHTPEGLPDSVETCKLLPFGGGDSKRHPIVCRATAGRVKVRSTTGNTQNLHHASVVGGHPNALARVITAKRHLRTHREVEEVLHVYWDGLGKAHLAGACRQRFIGAEIERVGVAARRWEFRRHGLGPIGAYAKLRSPHV